MTNPDTLLAAVDLTSASDFALRHAQAIAGHTGARLVVCHILPAAFRVRVLFPHTAGVEAGVQRQINERGRAAVEAHVVSVLGEAPSDIVIDSGSPHAGILDQAHHTGAALIVMGPGATAIRVARSAPCPSLIARPVTRPGAVVGATDFSDPALPAVREAHKQAVLRGAPLCLIHCLDVDETALIGTPLGTFHGQMVMPPFSEEAIRHLEARASGDLEAALAALGATGETAVSRLAPVRGILELARRHQAELIVVGTHGRSGVTALAMGSTAENLLNRSDCSVMVVPLGAGAEGSRRLP